MAIGTTAIVIGIVAIVVVAAIGVLVITTQPNISTTIHPSSLSNQSTIPSASTTATTLTSNSTASSMSTVCSITAESAGAAVRVLSDSGSPITGEQFSGANINPCGNSTISPIATDSSGWIALPGTLGTYNLTLSYQGRGYNVNVPMYPVTLTEVTLRVPSGVFSVDVVPYGAHPVFSGPSFASASGGLQLNVTLGNSTVQAGSFLPIRVAFVGRGAWNASYADVSMVVTNSAGVNVENITQSMPDLYSIPYTNQLQGFTSYLGWNARNQTNTVPIAPGEYTLVFAANIDGQLLRVQGTVQVVSSSGSSSMSSSSVTSSTDLSSGASTCYSGPLLTDSSSATKVVSVYNVTAQFNSWNWNGTSFSVVGYHIRAIAYSNSANKIYLEPQVFFQVSNGQETETASYTNLGAWNGQSWPPDFGHGPASLFNGNVTVQWIFTCDIKVFVEITVVS